MSFDPKPGVAEQLMDGLTRILAPNPSPMTFRGTNSYILGHDRLVVIDPGPASDAHLDALVTTIAGRPVDHIILTHSHLDHSPLAAPLGAITHAPVLAYGDSLAGRSAAMTRLAAAGNLAGGEGVDAGFAPDQTLADGDTIDTDAGPLHALHTPGHMGNHLCFKWNGKVFSGDLVMGWASSLVSPPDGDLTDFMASCRRLATLAPIRLFPGHGAPVDDPAGTIQTLLTHRKNREAQILAALDQPRTPAEITALVYTDVAPTLWPIAERNVLAHLIDLVTRNIATPTGDLTSTTRFQKSS